MLNTPYSYLGSLSVDEFENLPAEIFGFCGTISPVKSQNKKASTIQNR
jgi:hypothetical protein